MDWDEKKAFKGWLSTANNHELQMSIVKIQALESHITDKDAQRMLRYLKRETLREIEARRELAVAIDNRK